MENTIIIAIVSLLCILAHVPTLILRIVPFHEKISDKDRIRLTVIYAIGLAVDFGICMWVGNYRKIDVPFYKINLIACPWIHQGAFVCIWNCGRYCHDCTVNRSLCQFTFGNAGKCDWNCRNQRNCNCSVCASISAA